jgi:hypothetical protein
MAGTTSGAGGVLSNETTLDENAWHLIKEMGRSTMQQFP